MTHPIHFDSADEFCDYINETFDAPYIEHQGGGAWIAADDDQIVASYDEDSGIANWEEDVFVTT